MMSLYKSVLEQFERLLVAGVKFGISTLQLEAIVLIVDAPDDSRHHQSVTSKSILDVSKMSLPWVQHFKSANDIVLSCHTEKLLIIKSKQ